MLTTKICMIINNLYASTHSSIGLLISITCYNRLLIFILLIKNHIEIVRDLKLLPLFASTIDVVFFKLFVFAKSFNYSSCFIFCLYYSYLYFKYYYFLFNYSYLALIYFSYNLIFINGKFNISKAFGRLSGLVESMRLMMFCKLVEYLCGNGSNLPL